MKAFFDTVLPKLTPTTFEGSCCIMEHKPSADLKRVVWKNVSGLHFDHELAQKFTSLFDIAGSPEIFRKDCDGIMIFESEGRKYIFLTELKSGFGTERLYKAKRQLLGSYLKLSMILSLAQAFSKEDFIVKFFIIGYPPKPDFLQRLNDLSMLPASHPRHEEYQFAKKIFWRKESSDRYHAVCAQNEIKSLEGMSLTSLTPEQEVDFFFIAVPPRQPEIKLDIRKYL